MDKIKNVTLPHKIYMAASAVVGIIASRLGTLAVPLFILIAAGGIDYITALVAVKYRNQIFDSRVGFWGIVKKLTIWCIPGIGWLLDQMISYCVTGAGMTYPLSQPITIVLALWLSVNEFISIFENIGDILGDRAPTWIAPILKMFKSKIEEVAEIKEETNE